MNSLFTLLALLPLEFFGRGGGGGSSSSGGGFSSGSSSSSYSSSGYSSGSGSDGSLLALAVAFFPMLFVGNALAQFRKKSPKSNIICQIIGWVVALGYATFWVMIMPGFGIVVGITAILGLVSTMYSWFGKAKQKTGRFIKSQLAASAATDSAWDESKLVEFAKATFMKYQQDWSKLDSASMKTYMTPNYHYYVALLLYVLQTMGRRNLMTDITISDAVIVAAVDEQDNNNDQFTIQFTASAKDQLVEASTDEIIFTDSSTFREYWTFTRSGKTWLLDRIDQSTADTSRHNSVLASLAAAEGYRFSEDMGWLFIPRRGQLFGEAKFGTSDINNHIVGLHNKKLLVQLYTYSANPGAASKSYVVAQVNVPKQYGNIIVRRKGPINLFGIKGLQKVETEWTKFNDRYEVYASNYEGATSFELLNPTYMEQLEALPFNVNIEVVDDVIYLYTNERDMSVETYQTMLELINKAFAELRL